MNDLRKRLGIDDWLEIIKEDRVCNGAYISIAQYMYLLEKENKKYKEVINKVKQFCDNDNNFWILDAYSQDDVYEIQEKLSDMLNEVEEK